MNRRNVFVSILLVFGMTACVPYVISYKHVCFKESTHVRIVSRSTSSTDSQGNPVHWAKVGLPTKILVKNKNYTISIYTPINPLPVVFFNVVGLNGRKTVLKGSHLVSIQNEYEYAFMVNDASGEPLRISIIDNAGEILGEEILPYTIKSRGFVMGIDSI